MGSCLLGPERRPVDCLVVRLGREHDRDHRVVLESGVDDLLSGLADESVSLPGLSPAQRLNTLVSQCRHVRHGEPPCVELCRL